MTTRSINRLLLLLQLTVSIACTVMFGFLDDEVHSLGDLLRLENIPALVLYTLGFFVITMVVRAIALTPDEPERQRSDGLAK